MMIDDLAELLPNEPDPEMEDWILSTYRNELGGEFCLYRRETVEIAPPIEKLMGPEEWEAHRQQTKRRWGAVCNCTACTEEFLAGYETGVGIRITQGEDGLFYEGYCENGDEGAIVLSDGDGFLCPHCLSEVELVRESKVRNGRTYQLQSISLEVIAGFTVLVYWMTTRRLDAYGCFYSKTRPRTAAILLESGRVICFTKTHYGQFGESPLNSWRRTSSIHDPQQQKYYDWPSINNTKMGAVIWRSVPDLAGSTAEKTAIDAYILAGGEWPLVYFKTWAYYPSIENLVRAGWLYPLEQWIDHEVDIQSQYQHETSIVEFEFLDFTEAKPHRMLHMTREELRQGRSQNWTYTDLMYWNTCWTFGYLDSASDFQHFKQKYGGDQLASFVETLVDGWILNLYEIDRYLDRQIAKFGRETRHGEMLRLYLDYLDMADQAAGGLLPPTKEAYYPRDLLSAHERYSEIQKARAADEYREDFQRVYEKCRELEWTDGNLCIRLPRHNGELVAEGEILRHCVGSYGKSHAGGENLIFFVRKYRRPERSYYTLNETIANFEPRRIQLHGYGNERHGTNKEYRHRIPQQVTDFVRRWELEILLPWCRAMQAIEMREKADAKRPKKRRCKTA